MTLDTRDFNNYADDAHYSELMKFLSESHNMRETAKNSLKQSLYAATGAFAGSFVLGPIGGLLGGVSGSILGYLQSDNYDGAIVALTKLESERQKRLMKEVYEVLKQAGVSYDSIGDLSAFRDVLYSYAEQDEVRNGIWKACIQSTKS